MNQVSQSLEEFKKLYSLKNDTLITSYKENIESAEYAACSFILNNRFVHFRTAKITPTKIGQFVTFWKRNDDGITKPYDVTDTFDSLIVYTKALTDQGFFLFPKNVLLEHGILSKDGKGGKRGFRLYPSWDTVENRQAENTQKWQQKYFTKF